MVVEAGNGSLGGSWVMTMELIYLKGPKSAIWVKGGCLVAAYCIS